MATRTDGGSASTLLGYTDRLSVTAGDRQRFMISVEPAGTYGSQLVRLIQGEASPAGTVDERVVESSLTGVREGSTQAIRPGSYLRVDDVPIPAAGTLGLAFRPLLLSADRRQILVDLAERLTIAIVGSGLTLLCDGREVTQALAVAEGAWVRLVLAWVARSARVALWRLPAGPGGFATRAETVATLPAPVDSRRGTVAFAASLRAGHAAQCYNGLIELPWLARTSMDADTAFAFGARLLAGDPDEQVVAAWDFSRAIGTDRCHDIAARHLDGRFVNTPRRAVMGTRWDGTEFDWTRAPAHYGAVHFHEDDITDAGWRAGLEWQVPAALPSGVYAVRLEAGDAVRHVPFFVRPAATLPKRQVLFLASTATYLAYANSRLDIYAAAFDPRIVLHPNSEYLRDHPEVGHSLYERHVDGSGVHYSSHRRPILNLAPNGRIWSLNADLNVIAWLEHIGITCDVVTDADLDREGAALLADYPVVVTGTHPEYASTTMLDALEAYLGRGGRLMYLGGNGFYWRIAFDPADPAIIELRRAGYRGLAWDALPGESHHAFTGEAGGLWRHLGRPPNRLVGIGFVALAGDTSTHYRRQCGADDPRARFIFEGTREGEHFGAYGVACGGAVSQEIDRCNVELDSPAHTLILASSHEPPADFRLVREEADTRYRRREGERLRADMVFFETPARGAVFSTGSIGYAGALAHRGYDNDCCRIATNVLRRFIDPRPFARPDLGPP
jgi:N,N-dimethylformamidase beta subunit-like, C-terminal